MMTQWLVWTLMATAGLAFANPSQKSPAPLAEYFRVWQGFQNAQMTSDQFLGELPSFMRDTVELYGKAQALNQYLVVIPPKNKPDFIPDELALVALTSESAYQTVRATPEGKRYSERHWDIFEKGKSQSAKRLVNYFAEKPAQLEPSVAYSILPPALNWNDGFSLVYIGTRKNDITAAQYLARLKSHIELASRKMGPQGLRGYIVIANEDYEVAYLNWPSQEAHDRAVASLSGKAVFGDASEFMDTLMYEPAFDLVAGEAVDYGRFYKTHRPNKKALIVVTSHSQLGSTGKKTGYYFPEVAHPYFELSKAGIQVDIASPQGGLAPMDPSSLDLTQPINRVLHRDRNFMQKLNSTQKLSNVESARYSAILFAGGHGTMWDFKDSSDIQTLTASIYENGGVVAGVCHGPAALVDVKLSNGNYLVEGKRVTAFTNEEEESIHLTQVMPFLLEDALISHGARFQQADLWQEKVVVDERLVTGQNPASASGVGKAVAQLLK